MKGGLKVNMMSNTDIVKSKWSKLYQRVCVIFHHRGMRRSSLSDCVCGVHGLLSNQCKSDMAWLVSLHGTHLLL